MKTTLAHRANPAQERWHRASYKVTTALLGAGVGVGKTEAIAYRAVILALKNPGMPGLVASHVFNHMRTVIRPRIVRFLKQCKMFSGERQQDKQILVRNGSIIQYGSADLPKSLEGQDVAWALGDELRFWKRESYEFFSARVRIGAAPYPFLGFTSTLDRTLEDEWKDRSDRTVVYGTTYENEANLRVGYIDDLKSRLSDRLFKQYVLAQWMPSERAVFPEFEEDLHLKQFEVVENHPVHVFFDPGQQKASVLFAQHFDTCFQHACKNCVHVFDEIQENATATAWLAPKIKGLFNKHGWTMGKVYLDPAGRAKGTAVGLSDVDILEGSGFKCFWTTDPARRDIRNGIELIRGKLAPMMGPPTLYFHPKLKPKSLGELNQERGIIRSLKESEYPKSMGTRRDEPIKDGLLDHARDALRYGLINLCEMPGTSWARGMF